MSSNSSSKSAAGLLVTVFSATLFSVVILEIFNARLQGQQLVAFWIEFARDDGVAAWLMLATLCLGIPLSLVLSKWNLGVIARQLDRRAVLLCFGSFLFFGLLMTYMAFRHPFVADEYFAVFAAKTFATGHLRAQIPPDLIEAAFPRYVSDDTVALVRSVGQAMPVYGPGNALLMTPFAALHLEWLYNPFITALSLWILYKVSQQLIGEKGGIYALVFALASPVLALNAAAFFSMPAHLLLNLLFCWAFIQNKRWLTFLAGVIGSYALVLNNPAPHFTFALPWILWTCRYRPKQLFYLLAGYCVIFIPVSFFWASQLQTFDAGRYIAQKATEKSGSSEIISRLIYTFRLPDSEILQLRLAGFIKLIAWASPGLIILAWYGWKDAFSARKKARTPNENTTYLWLLGASLLTNFLFYFVVRFDQGHGWGFRYMHQTWFAFPILGAYAFSKISSETRAFRVPVKAYFMTLALLSVALLLPLRFIQGQNIMNSVLGEGPTTEPKPVGIIFYIETDGGLRDSLIQNDPFLRGDVWRFCSRDVAKNEAIARKYLVNPKLVSREKWGEMWSGERFNSFARS